MTTVIIVAFRKAYYSIVVVLFCHSAMTSVVIVMFVSDNSLLSILFKTKNLITTMIHRNKPPYPRSHIFYFCHYCHFDNYCQVRTIFIWQLLSLNAKKFVVVVLLLSFIFWKFIVIVLSRYITSAVIIIVTCHCLVMSNPGPGRTSPKWPSWRMKAL